MCKERKGLRQGELTGVLGQPLPPGEKVAGAVDHWLAWSEVGTTSPRLRREWNFAFYETLSSHAIFAFGAGLEDRGPSDGKLLFWGHC